MPVKGWVLGFLMVLCLSMLAWEPRGTPGRGIGGKLAGPGRSQVTAPRAGAEAWETAWYNETTRCVIVTSTEFAPILTPLATLKSNRGVKTEIVTLAQIAANPAWAGRDEVEGIHNMLRAYHANGSLEWVILGGGTDVVPTRYVYNDDTVQLGPGYHEDVGSPYHKPTDYYFADLEGSDWDEDNDGRWGESFVEGKNANGTDEISWHPEVAVGRLPAATASQMQALVDKLVAYETNPTPGAWLNTALLAGAISNQPWEANTDGEDEAWLTAHIKDQYIKSSMDVVHLYESTTAYTPDPGHDNLSTQTFGSAYQAGASITVFGGHSATTRISQKSPSFSSLFSTTNLATYANPGKPTFFYSSACDTAAVDYPSLAKEMVLVANGGAIGAIGAYRVSWYFDDDTNLEMLNRGMTRLFWENFFLHHEHQPGMALNSMRDDYVNGDYHAHPLVNFSLGYERKNVLTYNLLGDPEMPVRTRQPTNFSITFPQYMYAGQQVEVRPVDALGRPVRYARVYIQGEDGASYTTTNGAGDLLAFRFPHVYQNYTLTFSGPDVRPVTYTMAIGRDPVPPQYDAARSVIPQAGSIDEALAFTVVARDNESGISHVTLNLSRDAGATWAQYNLSATNETYRLELPLLPDGTYQYYLTVTDFAGNAIQIDQNGTCFSVNIPTPPVRLALQYGALGAIGIVTLVGVASARASPGTGKRDFPPTMPFYPPLSSKPLDNGGAPSGEAPPGEVPPGKGT